MSTEQKALRILLRQLFVKVLPLVDKDQQEFLQNQRLFLQNFPEVRQEVALIDGQGVVKGYVSQGLFILRRCRSQSLFSCF